MKRTCSIRHCGLHLTAALLFGWTCASGAAEIDSGIVERFGSLSMAIPGTGSVVICHGFGCLFRTQIGLSRADHGKLSQLLVPGRVSAEAERRAIAQAIAWFGKRVAPESGTGNAKARASGIAGDPSQFDCIDASTNTTSVLLVLDQLALLHHHRVEAPVSRSLGFHTVHTTAVLQDIHTKVKWAVDPWTHNNGELPDVLPLASWADGK
jgi:hypothetical protein